MAASSLSRCGRFPVFSSCSMTPTTMSSSMPWVSTLARSGTPPGEGGGVSTVRPALLGRCSSRRRAVGRGGDARGEELELEPEWERLSFFATCWPSTRAGGEREERGAPGRAMPSEGSESDFRRVLYGMLKRYAWSGRRTARQQGRRYYCSADAMRQECQGWRLAAECTG
jgi:hypothetical protein